MTLAELREALYDALVLGLDGWISTGALEVHAYIPDELATPCIWIDSPLELGAYDTAELVATANVLVVVDGAEHAQLAALDDLEGAAWVALETVGTATAATAVLLGAGGPTLHAVRLTVAVPIATRTLCPPALLAAT